MADTAKKSLTAVTHEHITVIPYQFSQLLNLSIKQGINRHGTLYIKGLVEEEVKDNDIMNTNFGTNIKVLQNKDNEEKVLFNGIVQKLSVHQEGNVYLMEVHAVTHTYKMDIKLKRRSFQNNAMTYSEMSRLISSEYEGGDTIFTLEDRPLQDFIIQYNETDWQFLMRMASHFNQGLYANSNLDGPKYHFGPPKIHAQHEIESHSYKVRKNVGLFQTSAANSIDNISSLDFIHYEVDSYRQLSLGEPVIFKLIHFYVREMEIRLEKGQLRNIYTLCTAQGMQQPYFENKQLQGVSISGNVLEIKRDKVKVHIAEIDPEQDINAAHWFTYATVYASKDGSGWYCMPEPGDKVHIQFAGTNDAGARAVSSVSRYQPAQGEPDKMADYNVRYIRNPQGMEIALTPDKVIISANNKSLIVLNQKGDIHIHGDAGVSVTSDNDITMTAGNEINMQASDRINMLCGNKAEIDLDKSGITKLKGTTVYTN